MSPPLRAFARGLGDRRLKAQIVANRLLARLRHRIGGGPGANADRRDNPVHCPPRPAPSRRRLAISSRTTGRTCRRARAGIGRTAAEHAAAAASGQQRARRGKRQRDAQMARVRAGATRPYRQPVTHHPDVPKIVPVSRCPSGVIAAQWRRTQGTQKPRISISRNKVSRENPHAAGRTADGPARCR